MTCKYCNGTKKIALLTSVVDCDQCKPQPPAPDVVPTCGCAAIDWGSVGVSIQGVSMGQVGGYYSQKGITLPTCYGI